MSNLHCIRHPKYDAKASPVLSCKTCCDMFIRRFRESQPQETPEQFLARKTKELEEWRKKNGHTK